MVNFQKAYKTGSEAVEFRAFAATTNIAKVMHHLATCFGIVRKAAHVDRVPSYKLDSRMTLESATEALERMWHLLGWHTSSKTIELAYGLFGQLYAKREIIFAEARRMAVKFETNYPAAFKHEATWVPPVTTEPVAQAAA